MRTFLLCLNIWPLWGLISVAPSFILRTNLDNRVFSLLEMKGVERDDLSNRWTGEPLTRVDGTCDGLVRKPRGNLGRTQPDDSASHYCGGYFPARQRTVPPPLTALPSSRISPLPVLIRVCIARRVPRATNSNPAFPRCSLRPRHGMAERSGGTGPGHCHLFHLLLVEGSVCER